MLHRGRVPALPARGKPYLGGARTRDCRCHLIQLLIDVWLENKEIKVAVKLATSLSHCMLMSTVAALAIVGCSGKVPLTSAAAPLVLAEPGQGCANAIIPFQINGVVVTRTFHGPVNYPGICPVTISDIHGIREGISIFGMNAGNAMLDPQKIAVSVLPVLQGKRSFIDYRVRGRGGLFDSTFSYVSNESINIGGHVFSAKQYNFYERDAEGNLISSAIMSFADNPIDPLSPIYIGSTVTPEVAKFPSRGIYALELTFLPATPTLGSGSAVAR